jgi:glycosyltransferase involved in cell wall biosynthesis
MPKVSVVTITYNQEKYIRQTLDSFVAQQTDFKVEVLVSDDKSTDSTPEIIKEYAKKYPDLIKPVWRDVNLGAAKNCVDTMSRANGAYIALCEGDDYWTDPHKLQKQADFLDAHKDYALCFHPVKIFFDDNSKKEYVFPEATKDTKFTVDELFKQNFIQTNSVMYRKQKYDTIPTGILPLDWYLHLYHAQFGKIGFINTVMGAYRRHPGGIWWNSDKNIDEIWKKYGLIHLGLYVEVRKLVKANDANQKIIDDHITQMFNVLIETDKKYHTELLAQAVQRYPEAAEGFMITSYDNAREMDKATATREKLLQAQQQEIVRQAKIADEKEQQLKMIKNSRAWRLRNKVARSVGHDVI